MPKKITAPGYAAIMKRVDANSALARTFDFVAFPRRT
jgi:hypothetical protein